MFLGWGTCTMCTSGNTGPCLGVKGHLKLCRPSKPEHEGAPQRVVVSRERQEKGREKVREKESLHLTESGLALGVTEGTSYLVWSSRKPESLNRSLA